LSDDNILEKILQLELENAKTKLANYQKEWKHFKQRFQATDDPIKFFYKNFSKTFLFLDLNKLKIKP